MCQLDKPCCTYGCFVVRLPELQQQPQWLDWDGDRVLVNSLCAAWHTIAPHHSILALMACCVAFLMLILRGDGCECENALWQMEHDKEAAGARVRGQA